MQENSLDAPAQWLKYVILKLKVSSQLKSNFNILRDLSQKQSMFGNDSKPQHKHTKLSMLLFLFYFVFCFFLSFFFFFKFFSMQPTGLGSTELSRRLGAGKVLGCCILLGAWLCLSLRNFARGVLVFYRHWEDLQPPQLVEHFVIVSIDLFFFLFSIDQSQITVHFLLCSWQWPLQVQVQYSTCMLAVN